MGDADQKGIGMSFEAPCSSVSKRSEDLEEVHLVKVAGYDFNRGLDLMALLKSFSTTGFQASNLGDAIEVVNQMLAWRLSYEEPAEDCPEEERDPAFRESVRCKIFLGVTSNLISSGVRDTVRFLMEHRMVDVLVTTAGGIAEDLIKCLAPTYKGDFSLPGASLRSRGFKRIGNLLVTDNSYQRFQDWIVPILDQMLEEQRTEDVLWSPSKVVARLGKEVNDPSSYLYWASKNNIPVFCPALTDGSLGDVLYSHSRSNPTLVIDIHHVCNANMMRNGADYAVYINTAEEFDGSDSGAHPDEAVSWGKIRGSAKPVKVHCDATIAFPLLVAATFAKSIDRSA
ncbi:unnamed protein product [Spirodela intermedia]|uniref:Uncharacterized protein n=1 Tax=Spirodela intermedia TaxID=51605 RepID=A0A7I8ISF3_SPIIN|nr:unnamed protein product [Spirodela intermedia]CAA6660950.1 unnamed protein product [Spirodela intermedia]